MSNLKITNHGFLWVSGKNEIECPECFASYRKLRIYTHKHIHYKFGSFFRILLGMKAYTTVTHSVSCKCEKCGCKFYYIRKEEKFEK